MWDTWASTQTGLNASRRVMAERRRDRYEGRACHVCECRTNILPLFLWFPEQKQTYGAHTQVYPALTRAHARCFDTTACAARVAKRDERGRLRSSRIYLSSRPGRPAECAREGHCGWCGEPMWRVNKAGDTVPDRTRNYHRAERDERDCRKEADGEYCFSARTALKWDARNRGETELRCVDCGGVCWCAKSESPNDDAEYNGREWMEWQADHEIPLEDGGEHVIENLRCRCTPCHGAKTAREAGRRASARR